MQEEQDSLPKEQAYRTSRRGGKRSRKGTKIGCIRRKIRIDWRMSKIGCTAGGSIVTWVVYQSLHGYIGFVPVSPWLSYMLSCWTLCTGTSVADPDPDPGSGAFVTPGPGSGIRNRFISELCTLATSIPVYMKEFDGPWIMKCRTRRRCWGSWSASGSVGSVCFWASRIRIRIRWSQVRIRLRILPLSSKNSKKNQFLLLYDYRWWCNCNSAESGSVVPGMLCQ